MTTETTFPAITVNNKGDRFKVSAAVELASILKANLLGEQKELSAEGGEYLNTLDPRKLQGIRTAFVTSLSSLPEEIILEMRISSVPDLACMAHGRLSIVFVIITCAYDEEKAKETVIAGYLSFMNLLTVYFPEGEFRPVASDNEAAIVDMPATLHHALAVRRREESIQLSHPFQKSAVGLLADAKGEERAGQSVRHIFPWIASLDEWSHLLDMLMAQIDPVQLIVRLKKASISTEETARMEDTVRQCENFLHSGVPYQLALKKQVEMIRDCAIQRLVALSHAAYQVGVFLAAPHPVDNVLGDVVGQAVTRRGKGGPNENIYQGGYVLSEVPVDDAMDEQFFGEAEAFSAEEAACAFRIPSPPVEDRPGLALRQSRTGFAMLPGNYTVGEGRISLFVNKHRHSAQEVSQGIDDRMRHAFIIGQTGTGKSTLMESMIMQDIQNGRGLAVIDPHGEMIDSILGKIPKRRVEDVILFNFLDRRRPIGFNPLKWSTLDERDLIIDDIYTTFDHLYDMKQTGGPIFEMHFRGMMKLLMGDQQDTEFTGTMLEFSLCYLDARFRSWLLARIKDPVSRDFVKEAEDAGGDARIQNIAPYITSKFNRFINDTTLRRIVGQEKTAFDFDDIINNGKIFLVKLGKGRFGSQVSGLLTNQLVTRFKYAAMKRGDMKPRDRREFFLYIDECHNLPSDNITELLSEARKYRMGLVLATQYAAQLAEKAAANKFLSAVIGNVGSLFIFRLGQEDARLMSPILQPQFGAMDVVGLPNWHGYARMHTSGDSVPPFSFATRKEETPYKEAIADLIINLSRQKYGMAAEDVDEQINARRLKWKKEEERDVRISR
ncbi:MAG: type IV secretion system DNA-binding domain-containing protein [Deltaproteobacteria bacterium]|nr:type IV secretion system DNA-binding domain-containing protein [Deltaproteobacteria bacterium]